MTIISAICFAVLGSALIILAKRVREDYTAFTLASGGVFILVCAAALTGNALFF